MGIDQAAAGAPPAHRRMLVSAKLPFWLMVCGVVLNVLALVAWSIGGPAVPGSATQTAAFVVAVFLQVFAAGFLLSAMILGIRQLVQRVRPVVWPILATLSLPIAFVLWMPLVFVVFLILG